MAEANNNKTKDTKEEKETKTSQEVSSKEKEVVQETKELEEKEQPKEPEAKKEESKEEDKVEEPAEEAEESTETKIPDFRPGDTVRIKYRIIEGEKTRIQPFEGIVISKKGSGISKTFTLRRIGADSIGVERILPLHSPNIVDLEVLRKGKARRAKLYYLRGKKGRAAMRIKERKGKSSK